MRIDQESIKRGKKQVSEMEVHRRLDSLETNTKALSERLAKCEVMKEQQAQFIFQSVSMTVGLFAIILAILIGFSTKWDFDRNGEGLVIALLFYIGAIITVWVIRPLSQASKDTSSRRMDSSPDKHLKLSLFISVFVTLSVSGIVLVSTAGMEHWWPYYIAGVVGAILLLVSLYVYFVVWRNLPPQSGTQKG